MNEPEKTRTKFHIPTKQVRRRRGILKWFLLLILILIVAAFIKREWIGFQFRALKAEYGSSESRAQALNWFITNAPREAKHVFFKSMLKDPQLRDLAIQGLLESEQQELMPVYMYLWRSDSTDKELIRFRQEAEETLGIASEAETPTANSEAQAETAAEPEIRLPEE